MSAKKKFLETIEHEPVSIWDDAQFVFIRTASLTNVNHFRAMCSYMERRLRFAERQPTKSDEV